MRTDIAVIGGGASGLAAAITAKECCAGADVVVIEKAVQGEESAVNEKLNVLKTK